MLWFLFWSNKLFSFRFVEKYTQQTASCTDLFATHKHDAVTEDTLVLDIWKMPHVHHPFCHVCTFRNCKITLAPVLCPRTIETICAERLLLVTVGSPQIITDLIGASFDPFPGDFEGHVLLHIRRMMVIVVDALHAAHKGPWIVSKRLFHHGIHAGKRTLRPLHRETAVLVRHFVPETKSHDHRSEITDRRVCIGYQSQLDSGSNESKPKKELLQG